MRALDSRITERMAGLTLLEILMVLALLASLAAYAMHGYRESLSRGYRFSAVTALYRAEQFVAHEGLERTRERGFDATSAGASSGAPAAFDGHGGLPVWLVRVPDEGRPRYMPWS